MTLRLLISSAWMGWWIAAVAAAPPLLIEVHCPGADARTVAVQVAPVLEGALKGSEGVASLSALCERDRCRLFVLLKNEADRSQAGMKLAERLRVLKLPAACKGQPARLLPDADEAFEVIALHSDGTQDPAMLAGLAELWASAAARMPDVAQSAASGGVRRWSVTLNPEKLAVFNVSLTDAAKAMRDAVKTMKEDVAGAEFAERLSDAVVATKAGGLAVRLKDIAAVSLGREGQEPSGVILAGQARLAAEATAVLVWIHPAYGKADAVRSRLKRSITEWQAALPAGVLIQHRSFTPKDPCVRLCLPHGASAERWAESARHTAGQLRARPAVGGVFWSVRGPEVLLLPWRADEKKPLLSDDLRRALSGLEVAEARIAAGCSPRASRPWDGMGLVVRLKATSEEAEKPAAAAETLRATLAASGLVLATEPGVAAPEIRLKPDLAKAAAMGLTAVDLELHIQAVSDGIRMGMAGAADRGGEVVLKLSDAGGRRDFDGLRIMSSKGERIPFGAVVESQIIAAETCVYRADGAECRVVFGAWKPGARAEALAVARRLAAGLPNGIQAEIDIEQGR